MLKPKETGQIILLYIGLLFPKFQVSFATAKGFLSISFLNAQLALVGKYTHKYFTIIHLSITQNISPCYGQRLLEGARNPFSDNIFVPGPYISPTISASFTTFFQHIWKMLYNKKM